MSRIELLALVLSITVTHLNAARILGIVPTPSYSHQITLRPVWNELSSRGHQVTVLTTDPAKDPKYPNITEISLHGSYKTLQTLYSTVQDKGVLEVFFEVNHAMDTAMDEIFSLPKVKSLIKNESLFDLVIVETFIPEYLAFTDLYQCPGVLMSSYQIPNFIQRYFANSANPISNPDLMLPFVGGNLNFKERIISFIYNQFYVYFKWLKSFPIRYEILKRHFGEDIKHPDELLRSAEMLLLNINPLIHDVVTIGADTVTFGGGVHITPPKPLPKDIKDYLDSATEGCIYFSLGTNSKSMYMGDQKIQIIMDTLSELPYKVMWKFENEAQIKPPRNVKLLTWAPQQDILRHPNVKLFISQGGIQSIEESVINHIPMVMLPMYGDQEANAKRMEHRGLARIVPHKPIPNKEEFKSIILDVINDPKYKEKVIKTAELLMDQPMGGVEKAVWWIEYVLRHKGAKHLRSPAADIPTYQYYCLDVIGTILLFALMVSYIIYKTISFVFRLIKKLFSRSKTVSNKKKKH